MAIGVVGIHSGVVGLKTFGRLGVPFFLITSSYFFFKKYKFSSTDYLKKYLQRIFFLYLAWQIIFTPLFIMQFKEDLSGDFTVINILVHILEFLFYARHNGWGQSWYLLAILYGLPILIYLIKRVPKYILLLFFILTELYFIVTQGYSMFWPKNMWVLLPLTTLRALPYLYVGYILVMNNDKLFSIDRKNMTRLLILFIGLFVIENLLVDKLFGGISNSEEVFTTLPAALVVFIWSLNTKLKFKFTQFFRHFSTFLYVIHKAIISFIVRLNLLEQEIIVFLMTLAISILLYVIFVKIKNTLNWKWLSYLT